MPHVNRMIINRVLITCLLAWKSHEAIRTKDHLDLSNKKVTFIDAFVCMLLAKVNSRVAGCILLTVGILITNLKKEQKEQLMGI